MNSSNKMSRRDWFRLKAPATESLLGNQTAEHVPTDLQPLESPPNHDGMDLSQLPPMREAQLTHDQLVLLFGDIERLGTDIHLFQRARTGSLNVKTDNLMTLASAKSVLLDGTAKRIQIRYRWDGSLWIDTIENVSGDYRLLRIAHANL